MMKHINERGRPSPHYSCITKELLLLLIVISVQLVSTESLARNYLYAERPKLGLEYSYSYEKDVRESPFLESERVSKIYNEIIDISTAGWYYHPALLVYSLEFSPTWKQTSETDMSAGDSKVDSNTYLTEYNAEITILKDKPYTLVLLGNRNTSALRSTLAEMSEIRTDIYQAMLTLKYPILPTNLNYRHTEGEQTGLSRSQKEMDDLRLNLRHHKYMGESSLDFSYSTNSEQSSISSTAVDSFDTTFQNVFSPGKNNKILNSSLNYSEKDSSTQLIKRFGANEYFNWLHRKNLTTNYTLQYDRTTMNDKLQRTPRNSEAKSIGFNLRHFLYENLTTIVNARAAENSSQNGRIDSYSSQVNFNYNRKIPAGNLTIAAGYDYLILDNKPRHDFISVINAPVRLIIGTPAFLEGSNINLASIHIRENPDTTEEYTNGTDYSITSTSSGVRITCITGGEIDNPDGVILNRCLSGTTVYVDYEFKSTTVDLSTFTQSYYIQLYLWDIWSVYYSVSVSDQKLLAGIPSEELSDNSSHAAGSALEWKWNRLSIDWEDHFEDTRPNKKWSIRDDVTLQPSENTFFKASGSYGSTLLKDKSENDKFMTFNSNLQKLITDSSLLELDFTLRKHSGETEEVLTKLFSANFQWHYRIWVLVLSYQYSNTDDSMNKQNFNNNYVSFKIKREMF